MLTLHPRAGRSKGSMGGSPPSHGVGWILGCSPDANGAMVHAAERHRRHPKVLHAKTVDLSDACPIAEV